MSKSVISFDLHRENIKECCECGGACIENSFGEFFCSCCGHDNTEELGKGVEDEL